MGFNEMAIRKIDIQLSSGNLKPEKKQELETQKQILLADRQDAEIQRTLQGKVKSESPKFAT
jgi:hypothetical protein